MSPEFFPRITIEETNNLTEQESDFLLYICNVISPIFPLAITPETPHPCTLSLITSVKRTHILDIIDKAATNVKETGLSTYNRLRCKFGLSPVEPKQVVTMPEQVTDPLEKKPNVTPDEEIKE